MAGNTVYVQGSYVDVHDNEVVNLSIDKAGEVHVGYGEEHGGAAGGLPKELQRKGIVANLEWLRDRGLLDDDYQPVYRNVQVNQLAAIADKIGEVYEIRNRWSVFERFWGKQKDCLRSSFAQLNANSEKHKEFSEKILKHIR